MKLDRGSIFDPLYGSIEFDHGISDLIRRPIVQRLRHVRLSNIDSLDLPGIAGVSRYEHSLGVAYLAQSSHLAKRLTEGNRSVLVAAALLHDAAITPYGHLIEEAFEYFASFDHERRLSEAFGGMGADLGHAHLQLMGRENGLPDWAEAYYGPDSEEVLRQVFDTIKGEGPLGGAIRSDVDLDNLDNLVRIAYHMGLPVDKHLPQVVASTMREVSGNKVIFSDTAPDLIRHWLSLRDDVYTRLMLSRQDFVGKVMLIYATVQSYVAEVIDDRRWFETDADFLRLLMDKGPPEARQAVRQWMVGELWPLTDLMWFEGVAPTHQEMHQFTQIVSERLGRDCLAYRIKDKATRQIEVQLIDGTHLTLGRVPNRWLLGVASPLKKEFTRRDHREVEALAHEHLGGTLQRAPSGTLELWG